MNPSPIAAARSGLPAVRSGLAAVRSGLAGTGLVILISLGIGSGLRAEAPGHLLRERWAWRVFDRQEGLPATSVFRLHQDRYEYIYASTEQGVSRYDLWEWTRLESTEPFGDGPVRRFVESTGALYAVTANVLWKVQGGTSLSPIHRGAELHAAASAQGEVFVIDVGAGAHMQVRGEAVERIDPDVRLPAGRVLDYQVDATRGHWLATSDGLFSREAGRRAWRPVRDRELPPALQDRVSTRFFRVQGPAPKGTPFPPSAIPAAWEELWALFESPGRAETGRAETGRAETGRAETGRPRTGWSLARLERGRWTDLGSMEGPAITGIVSDASRNYYATADDGRLHVSPDGRTWTHVQELGIGKVAISAEIADSGGTLWFHIGTGGIAAFDPQSRRWETIPTGSDQSYPNVLSLIETEEGDAWMGMTRGLAWNRRGAPPETYESVHGVALRSITGLGEDTLRRIWVSSGEAFPGALCFNESIWTRETVPGFSDHPVRRIVRDRAGELWFLSQEETPSGDRRIYHLSVTTSYNILPVTVSHGPVNDLIRTGAVAAASVAAPGMAAPWAAAPGPAAPTLAAPRDVFWLATDDGLLRATLEDESFLVEKVYTEENGLRSRRVFAVAEAADGAIWVCYPGSSAGVTRLKGDAAEHFDERDGLASPEVWSIASMGTNLWFGTDRGLSRFDGECWYNTQVASSDPRTSRILPVFPSISETDSVLVGTWGLGAFRFRLDDRRRPRRPRFTLLRLPREVPASRPVVFSWDARDYRNDTPPDALLFRSRLDGEPWVRFSHARSRQIPELAPGSHVFEVEVRDLDGNRNREEEVHRFTVSGRGPGPTLWIVGGVLGGLALGLVAFVALRKALATSVRTRIYRGLFRSHPIPLLVIDGEGTLLASSGIAPETLGVDSDELARSFGKPVHLLPLFMIKDLRAAVSDLLCGEPFRVGELRWAPDGRTDRVLDVRGYPLERVAAPRRPEPEDPEPGSPGGPGFPGGRELPAGTSPEGTRQRPRAPAIRLAVVFVEDTTRRTEEVHLLEKTRRLNSLRNLADRIVGRASGVFQEPGLRELARSKPRLLDRIREAESVLATLAEFAGSEADSSVWSTVSVNEILESLVGGAEADPAIRARVAPGVRVDYRGQPGIWSVRGDARRLRAALLEVVENALESMPVKGTLTIRTANARVEDDPGHLAPGAYVEVEVRDTGPGMDAGQLEHVLEPFFSTKPRDRAAGAGLSTAYGVVRAHGGDIRIESRPGQGTAVRILLPARRAG